MYICVQALDTITDHFLYYNKLLLCQNSVMKPSTVTDNSCLDFLSILIKKENFRGLLCMLFVAVLVYFCGVSLFRKEQCYVAGVLSVLYSLLKTVKGHNRIQSSFETELIIGSL